APEGRAGLLRRLRALEARGVIALEWTLSAAGAGPRFERRIGLTPEGREAAAAIVAGGRPTGRPLGPRQVGALRELLELAGPGAVGGATGAAGETISSGDTVPAADVAD